MTGWHACSLTSEGTDAWYAHCTCGWTSRICTSAVVASALHEEHLDWLAKGARA